MQFTFEFIILSALIFLSLILITILYFWVARLARHYNSLTKGVEPKTLINSLEGIQKSLAQHEHLQDQIKTEIGKIKDHSVLSLQHLTLKRFNPFGDTGGDQSFILAILDGNNDGIVITSLHSRENTRFYVKSVKGGVGIDHPLSVDEQKVINRKGK